MPHPLSRLPRLAAFACAGCFFLCCFWLRVPVERLLPVPAFYSVRFIALWAMLGTAALVGAAAWRARIRLSRADAVFLVALCTWALWAWAGQMWAFARAFAPTLAPSAALGFAGVVLFTAAVLVASRAGWLAPAQVCAALLAGAAVGAGFAWAQAAARGDVTAHVFGAPILNEMRFAADVAGTSLLRAGDGGVFVRPYGLLPHPNILGGVLALGLCAAAGLALGAGRARLRWGAAALIPVLAGALVLSFSRAAWLGLGAGGLVGLGLLVVSRPPVARARWRGLLISGLGAAAVLVGVGAALFPFVAARAGVGEQGVEMRSIADRIVYTDFALRAIAEAPLTGVGIGNFPWRSAYYLMDTFYDLNGDNVHNIYLLITAEQGLIGAGLAACALAVGVWRVLEALRRQPSVLRVGLAAGVCAWLAIGLFDHYPASLVPMQALLWGVLAAAGSRVSAD
jgi:hypothetical protein